MCLVWWAHTALGIGVSLQEGEPGGDIPGNSLQRLVRVKQSALGNVAVIPRFITTTLTQKRDYVISYLPSVIIICSVSLIIKTTTTVMRIHFHRISNWRSCFFFPSAFLAAQSIMHIKVFSIFKGKLGYPLLAIFGNKSEL